MDFPACLKKLKDIEPFAIVLLCMGQESMQETESGYSV